MNSSDLTLCSLQSWGTGVSGNSWLFTWILGSKLRSSWLRRKHSYPLSHRWIQCLVNSCSSSLSAAVRTTTQRKRFASFHRLQSVTKEGVRAEIRARNWRRGHGECLLLACFFFYAQPVLILPPGPPAQGGTTHSGMTPSILVIHRENACRLACGPIWNMNPPCVTSTKEGARRTPWAKIQKLYWAHSVSWLFWSAHQRGGGMLFYCICVLLACNPARIYRVLDMLYRSEFCHGYFPETAVRCFFLKYRQLVIFELFSWDQECICELIHRTLKLILQVQK